MPQANSGGARPTVGAPPSPPLCYGYLAAREPGVVGLAFTASATLADQEVTVVVLRLDGGGLEVRAFPAVLTPDASTGECVTVLRAAL